MRPVALHEIDVREVAAVLAERDVLKMVQHDVNRLEIRRYLELSDRQWWELVTYLRERDHATGTR